MSLFFKNYLFTKIRSFLKAYSSVVERTAHNGFVVGSNPTKLIIFFVIIKMKLKLKNFNYLKTANYLYNYKLAFFFQGINLKASPWTIIEHNFSKKKLRYYKLNNSITSFCLKNSIFKNVITLINSTNFLINFENNYNLNNLFHKLLTLDSLFYLLLVRLNNKLYVVNKQFFFINLNYKLTIKKFVLSLAKLSKILLNNIKKISSK